LEAQDIEIMMGLLTPRPPRTREVDNSQAVGALEASQVTSLVREARSEFSQRCASGDSIAAAILLLGQDGWTDEGIAQIQAVIAGASGGRSHSAKLHDPPDVDHVTHFIQDLAVENFQAGQIGRAAALFGTLLHLKTEEAEALSGLALCGVGQNRVEEALMLANECLKLPVKHPRAYCIAGFCELERGNRKAAQSLLALGARIARNRPEFAEEWRAAQRVLLILHFA
jgi:hypothetical protein